MLERLRRPHTIFTATFDNGYVFRLTTSGGGCLTVLVVIALIGGLWWVL